MAGATLKSGQISVTTTATLILAANANRVALTVQNIGAVPVYVGPSGVTASSTAGGALVSPGLFLNLTTQAAVYGITAKDTATVSYIEEDQ